jgi:hypothetical protein
MDLSQIKSKLSSLQTRQTGPKNDLAKIIWKPSVGKHSIRMVPSMFDKANPFKEITFHYGVGAKTMISLQNFGEKDPIVEFANELRKSSDQDSRDLAKKLSPKMRVFVPIVVRGEEDKGVRLWEFGKEVYMELLAIAEDEDVQDYTDPVTGRDLTVDTVGPESSGRSFNKTTVRVRTKTTPLSENSQEVQRWMTEQPEPLNLFKKYSYEEMKTALLSWLNPGEAQEETTTAPAAVTTQEAPKPSYTLETKASKASIDDDFAALFGDAPSSEGAPF